MAFLLPGSVSIRLMQGAAGFCHRALGIFLTVFCGCRNKQVQLGGLGRAYKSLTGIPGDSAGATLQQNLGAG